MTRPLMTRPLIALFGATLPTFARARGTETEGAREAAESSDARDGGASDAPFVCGTLRGVVPHARECVGW